jgi:hypothetical protein
MADLRDNTIILSENATTTIAMSPEIMELRRENEELKRRLENAIEKEDLILQNTIDVAPLSPAQLYGQACSGDTITTETFAAEWTRQFVENTEKHDVKKDSAMNDYKKLAYKPCICAGSGPSLKKNAQILKERGEIGLVSCLHNFGYFEDLGCPADYYINLDSQEITIPELFQGGKKKEEYYWEQTKDRTLVAATVTNPNLIAKWKGRILWYNVTIPDQNFQEISNKVGFNLVFNTGGNALGAAYYMARAILGACPIALVGADFSFSEKRKFHAWESPYDKMFSGLVPVTNIFGNRVFTWQSYFNFSKWFEYIALGGRGNNPCLFYNCTEGGILGAYPQGNIRHIVQMPLNQFIYSFTSHGIMEKIVVENNKMLLF